jgi:hypothetical protein
MRSRVVLACAECKGNTEVAQYLKVARAAGSP